MAKKLILGKKKKAGRSRGKITIRHRGSGHKRKYRLINLKRNEFNKPAKILAIEYDPNRSANIALVEYVGKKKDYFLASRKMKIGREVVTTKKTPSIKSGNRAPLKYIPIGTKIYNMAGMVRSAGSCAILQSLDGGYAQLKLPSKEIRLIKDDVLATIGQVSSPEHGARKLRKAGQRRWMGWRPTVRGTAMSAGDHPHGGGEARTGTGRNPKTPWGKIAIGGKTRKKHKKSNKLIIKRRNR